MKELVINGKVFAKYEIEGNRIYIKNIIPVMPQNEGISEDIAINIISIVEGVEIKEAAYLNV